jgi:hypothetical protein
MKLIEINKEHYVVVDETIDINESDYTFKNGEIRQVSYLMQDNGHIITHSTQPLAPIKELIEKGYDNILPLNIDEVKELIGEVDVDKFISKKAGKYVSDVFGNNDWNAKLSYIEGYNQALEDNKEKKYTEEDIYKAIQYGREIHYTNDQPFIQSLQPKTEWKVEIVDGKIKLK